MDASLEALHRARAERQRVLARITWWENHRYEALVPLALGAFGVGYGLAELVRSVVGGASQTGYYAGVVALFVAGRAVDRWFAPSRLAVLDARIAGLERRHPGA